MSAEDRIVEELSKLLATPPYSTAAKVFADWTIVSSRIGKLYVAFTDAGVSYIRTAESVHHDDKTFMEIYHHSFQRPLRRAERPPTGLAPALQRPATAKNVPVDLRHLTPFEREVLAATRRIPPGQTRPYAWVAREIGRPRAVRAVGTALGNNPVPVLIPCHRVIRSDGQLGQYIFGSEVKEHLLRAEGSNVDETLALAKAKVFYLGSDTTHIVCYPTCPDARRITPPHRHGFRTLPEALAAGYRPCHHCNPTT
ncbi:methylated-DNA--[protein]-cysteine S-methyltransferase [Actinokineospora iranica]|uniref:methylated-DNA--[protein]-cysteine S-methyltransferase n=1 Tax=Actinokineospora iranica TaxID=1271860 RepID=A0A1G6MBV0_9PSEU|nr:methylated-DNA--[protein]-cysteine S-methyltransferase [Actinokineospora iranica]SDC52415.1 O-6-methylguanine DNA methyltransferase [Actinokineospora iranica]